MPCSRRRGIAAAVLVAALAGPPASASVPAPIVPKLEPIRSSSVVVGGRASAYTAVFPARLGRRGVTVRDGRAWLSYRLEGAAGAGARGGRALAYPNVLPNVAAVYVPERHAIKEVLALRPGAPSTYRFVVRTSRGLRALRAASGAVRLVDRRGAVRFTFERPFMHDASPSLDGGLSHDVSLSVRRVRRATYRLTLSASRVWLQSSARRWPVVIDPTINLDPSRNFCESEPPTTDPLGVVRCNQPNLYAAVVPSCTLPTPGSFSTTSCTNLEWWTGTYLPGLVSYLTSPVVVYTPPPPSLPSL